MKCCELTAGKLRHQVTLSRKVSAPDGFGGFTVTWTSYATPKAYIKPMSGSERLQAERVESTTRVRCYLRYRNDIVASDKITYKGKDYNINAIINLEERDKWIELDLTQGEAV